MILFVYGRSIILEWEFWFAPKRCVSIHKNQFYEKTTKINLMDNFTMNIIWFCHFLLLSNTHLFGPETAVFDISTQFPQWVIYIYPCWYWKGKIRKNRIHQTKLQVWPIYGSTVTFMAFKLKSMAFPIELTPNDLN